MLSWEPLPPLVTPAAPDAAVAEPNVVAEPVLGAGPAAELTAALNLLRQMVGTNMRSLHIARQLMLAQDLAERHRSRVGPAIDSAALTGDEEAIERAVRAVNTADAADEEEWAISRDWAEHIQEVHALAELAEDLLARGMLSPPARA